MKPYQWNILWRILLLPLTFSAAAYVTFHFGYHYLLLLLPVLFLQLKNLYHFQQKTHQELEQFVEGVHYHDFSRHFEVKHAPANLQVLRKGFNEINSTFKTISRDKETQYQYLQKILELVGTGILSYEAETGDVVWMNETLKAMLRLPYLKNIHALKKRNEQLYQQIISLKNSKSTVVTLPDAQVSIKVLLSATGFQTEGKRYKLLALQNVNEALDETESRAWQKLLSVMTHEIMNSIAPISSLAHTLKNRLQEANASFTTEKKASGLLEDLELGIDTIRSRSEGLLKFAETYRNLNKITTLNVKKVFVRDLFESLNTLMEPTLAQKNIELDIVLKDTGLTVEVDPMLIEQVLINLLVNAIEAVKDRENTIIVLSGYVLNDKKTVLKIADNGTGMAEDLLEQIFVPFFSTKKNGSGIGLSLCKQIMLLHKAQIQVQSIEGEGTAFLLQF
ncbi:sensor histidine kinase [Mucilaginibacter arboris]|uniref:histidine kinase n=1 Tax=Mucilaginibacter arboris TaxID=2682090 RepID=A0A7K1SZB8_9SPHI|nr:HAMP domain-containing sensor histidine kinase [Mucilaginibacter arboris]MVN22643.1 ATP-binding protein [Mucilaginibacter arboris]